MKQENLPAIGLDECIAASGGTKALLTGNDVYGEIPRLLDKHYNSRRIFIIADGNTMSAAGKNVENVLISNGIKPVGRYIFPAEPMLHGEYRHIETLRNAMLELLPLTPMAIGAGTINDLVKKAADEVSSPYICIPTAASVDGYTSYGSAVLKDGYKQTLSCAAPRCIVADTGLMSRAPAWLSSSGFGDLAGKIIAGADWIISDAAAPFGAKGADRIDPRAWAMVQSGLYYYLARSLPAAQGDEDAIKALFEALSITGFAMQYLSDSRPVSGAEHLYAHVWEMDNLSFKGNPVSHGHKVAIGSLACLAFIEILFADPDGPPSPPADFCHPTAEERVAEIRSEFAGNAALESTLKTGLEKLPDEQILKKTREGFRDTWKTLRENVLEQILPYSKFKEMLLKAQCPVLPMEINLKRHELITCARRAQMIRMRYTALDLAWELGCFETVLAKMEASDKYF